MDPLVHVGIDTVDVPGLPPVQQLSLDTSVGRVHVDGRISYRQGHDDPMGCHRDIAAAFHARAA